MYEQAHTKFMGTTTATPSTVAAPGGEREEISGPIFRRGRGAPGAAANSPRPEAGWSGTERPPGRRTPGGGVREVPPGVSLDTSGISDSAEFRCPGEGRSRPRGRILGWMKKSEAVRRHLPTSPFKARVEAPPKHFAVGDRVTHDAYGLGRVIGVEGDTAVLVDFGSRQERIAEPYRGMFNL